MKKNEFISTLKSVLERNKISDTAEIVEEYEQHFAFKLADTAYIRFRIGRIPKLTFATDITCICCGSVVFYYRQHIIEVIRY